MVKVDLVKEPDEIGFGLKFKGGRKSRGQAAISVAHVDPGSAASRYCIFYIQPFLYTLFILKLAIFRLKVNINRLNTYFSIFYANFRDHTRFSYLSQNGGNLNFFFENCFFAMSIRNFTTVLLIIFFFRTKDLIGIGDEVLMLNGESLLGASLKYAQDLMGENTNSDCLRMILVKKVILSNKNVDK